MQLKICLARNVFQEWRLFTSEMCKVRCLMPTFRTMLIQSPILNFEWWRHDCCNLCAGDCINAPDGDYTNDQEADYICSELKRLIKKEKIMKVTDVVVVSAFPSQVSTILHKVCCHRVYDDIFTHFLQVKRMRTILEQHGLGEVSVQNVYAIQGMWNRIINDVHKTVSWTTYCIDQTYT